MVGIGPPASELGINASNLATAPKDYSLYSRYDRGSQKDSFLSPGELITQTDKFMKRFVELPKDNIPETIFFLDKSARPLAYMFRKLFPAYCPGVKMPEIRYINIGGSGSHMYDTDARPFDGNPDIIKKTYGGHINEQGKITIVDEYSHTGEALKKATVVMKGAFQQATITQMAAYDKLPNWYQNESYLGVEEYTDRDYRKIALQQVNQELKTNYDDLYLFSLGRNEMLGTKANPGVDYEHIPPEIRTRYDQILQEIEGTIPYVKKGEHIQTHYEYPKPSIIQRLKRETPKAVEVKENVFRQARSELDTFCEAILETKNQANSPTS